jgi:DNA polymerase-1
MAQYSQEPKFLETFYKGGDLHTSVACEIFNITEEEYQRMSNGTKEEQGAIKEKRKIAKAVNFGILYGSTAAGLARTLHIPMPQAEEFLNKYLTTFPKIKEFQNKTHGAVQLNLQVTSVFGRIRRLPDAGLVANQNNKEVTRKLTEALRQSVNSLIQGTAADCTNLACVKIGRRLRDLKLRARMVLTVHDELIFETPIEEVEQVQAIVKEIMEHPTPAITVPLKVDVKVVDNWTEGKL